MCTSIAIDSASQRSLSQLGPSSAVSLKMTWLTTPHSGFSMKRIDRIVGIDGTAHGRMNSTDSHLIHGRAVTKKPDRNSATSILRLIATTRNTSVLTTDPAKIGSSNSCDVAFRMPREPQAVADRVHDEHQEHETYGASSIDAPHAARATRAFFGGSGCGPTASVCGSAIVDIGPRNVRWTRGRRAPPPCPSDVALARDLLDAGDHLVGRLLDRPLLARRRGSSPWPRRSRC